MFLLKSDFPAGAISVECNTVIHPYDDIKSLGDPRTGASPGQKHEHVTEKLGKIDSRVS